jgi:hypothetical protein
MFLAAASLLHNVAQILGMHTLLPSPSLLFSGRLYAHLHSRTALGVSLSETLRDELPDYDMDILRCALLACVCVHSCMFACT